MTRRVPRSLCALLACLSAAPPTHAEPSRPRVAGRVVQVFDFEEPANPLPVPRGWTRGQSVPTAGIDRPGFPVWNGAAFDTAAPAHAGNASVMLPVRGGSASMILTPGVIPVFPSADYRVTAQVRTSPEVRHARAFVAARLLDERGALIDGTEVRSPPIVTDGRWREVSVDVFGEHPDAAFMQLELLALQPELMRTGLRRSFEVDPQDYNGAVWFDDVVIVQRPRIEVATSAPGNIATAPDRPEIIAHVRDLAGERMDVTVEILDHTGQRLASRLYEGVTGRLDAAWTPELDRYGWFRARIVSRVAGETVGESWCDMLWVPPAGAGAPAPTAPDRARLGVRVGRLPADLRAQVPVAIGALGVGAATAPVWDARGGALTVDELSPMIEGLLIGGVDVSMSLERVPLDVALAAGVGPADVPGLLRTVREPWGPAIDPVFDRFGQRVRAWQVSSLDDPWGASGATTPADIERIEETLSVLVPAPIVGVPWAFDLELAPLAAAPNRRAVVPVPRLAGAEGVRQTARAWLDNAASARDPRDAPELQIVLSPDPDPGVAHAGEISAMARQAIVFWDELGSADHRAPASASSARDDRPVRTSLELATPWRVSGGPRPDLLPTPALGVWRTLIDMLAERELVERLDLGPGVSAYLLSPRPGTSAQRGSAIALWRTPDANPVGSFQIDLGTGPVEAVDLFGNRARLARTPAHAGAPPSHTIAVSDTPVFIEGIDAGAAVFQTGVRLDPGRVISSSAAHEHDLVVRNPWDFPLRARLFIVEPGGHSTPATPIDRSWQILPRVSDVTIPPRSTARVPVSVSFSPAALTGRQELVVDADLGGSGNVIRARGSFELHAPEVTMEVFHRVQPPQDPGARDDDVIVFAEVTNNSGEPISAELVGVAPGIARTRASIATLEPGQSAVRPIPFYGLASRLRGREVRVGLTLPDTERRVNVATVIGDDAR